MTFAVSPKYLSKETKIYIFITRTASLKGSLQNFLGIFQKFYFSHLWLIFTDIRSLATMYTGMDTELEWQKSKDKELTRLFWNKFNVSDYTVYGFFSRLVMRL